MDKNFIVSLDTQSFDNEMSICPICDKKFFLSQTGRSKYAYKKRNKNGKTRYSCSYSCYNKLLDIIADSSKTR